MRNLPLLAVAALLSCMRGPSPYPALEEDTSIVFPEFYERFAVIVGQEEGQPYEVDGVALRAITIAANDFIPPSSEARPCWRRQEAYRYRVIRHGDIIFVDIGFNPYYCKVGFGILDGGVRYAISSDGRILRRHFDGEPKTVPSPEPSDGGEPEFKGTPVPFSSVGSIYDGPVPGALPPEWLDGGVTPAVDGGSTPTVDGGSTAWPLK